MSSFSYAPGTGAVLSLEGFVLPSHGKERKSHALRSEDVAIIGKFESVIDDVVKEVFNEVLNKVRDVGPDGKLLMGVVRCNISDVERITDGVVERLQREISSTVVLKPDDTNMLGVVNKIRSDNGKGKRMLIVEQAESLSPQLLNGLFYSISSIDSDIIILLCLRMSTKRTTFFSALSRRVLASFELRSFSIAPSEEVFDRLVSAVLLNPSFTHLKVEPSFARFLRASFFRDDFSITFVKKSLRFALMQHLWKMHKLPPDSNVCSRCFLYHLVLFS
ncbi:hypothetical protein GCK32_007286 [Trichostrongylus colubriformis]|uniref:Origin recognition complex subunit 3 N-terminal domain-containing protein n=1 Tax=Trichostrongylus colubriformis TaxID=6319 RepID=A0AAN8EVP6_TRICO